MVMTGIANVHCALQLKINFQVPPSVAGFKSILGLFIPIHVYGLVCPLSLSGPAGFLHYLPPSLRSYLLPSGEQHKNELGAMDESHSACPGGKVVLLASFSQNVGS